MIGTIDIAITSFHQNVPLETLRSFVGSPSSVRLRNVPKDIGSWRITSVKICASYPDNTIRTDECALANGLWVGTLPACTRSGRCASGFSVTADGIDENGNAVSGYVLGVGDVEVYNLDQTIGGELCHLRLLDQMPSATCACKGDVVNSGGWKVYDGCAWVALGGGGDEIWEAESCTCTIYPKGDFGCYDLVVRGNYLTPNGISMQNASVGCEIKLLNSSGGIVAPCVPHKSHTAQISFYSQNGCSKINLQSDILTWNGSPIGGGGGDSIWVADGACHHIRPSDAYYGYCISLGGITLGGCTIDAFNIELQDYLNFKGSCGGVVMAQCVDYCSHSPKIEIASYCGKSQVRIESDELLWNGSPIGGGGGGGSSTGNWILYSSIGGSTGGCYYSIDNVLLTFEEHPSTGRWMLKGDGEPYGTREQKVGSIYAIRYSGDGCIATAGKDFNNLVWQNPCVYDNGGYDKELYLYCSNILNMTVGCSGNCIYGISLTPVLASFGM